MSACVPLKTGVRSRIIGCANKVKNQAIYPLIATRRRIPMAQNWQSLSGSNGPSKSANFKEAKKLLPEAGFA